MDVQYISLTDRTIYLGKSGENRSRELVFDVGEWIADFGEDGAVYLLHQRLGDRDPYPAVITREGRAASWVITTADVNYPGKGKAELQYRIDDMVVKSSVFDTIVDKSLGDPVDDIPDPEKDWVTEVLEAAENVRTAAVKLPYVDAATGTWWEWNFDTGQYEDTGKTAGTGGGGGSSYELGNGLAIIDGKLTVTTTDKAETGNNNPITSAAVYALVGDIEALLTKI